MASDHQIALSRPHRMPTPSSSISKAARQVVPAFLQKLYEMVNDPNNAELIRWSEAGDSFFVLDHERFAHEVLGRWFKHRNFSSFVRQLNMYGFHKIPHLQQGVLKSDTDTEFWNFAHAHFHRGQPDMLCLIQRKKQVPQPGEEGALDFRDPSTGLALPAPSITTTSPVNPTLSSGQILDVNSIVNGIAAIKRHQTTISAELNELKRSNQLLWQDALDARAKHQKQQDTINRIVKFLASVFGAQAAASVPVSGASPNGPGGQQKESNVADTMTSGSRRRMRLMIEDAKRDGPKKSMVEELSEIPMETDEYELSHPSIETPTSIASPSPSVTLSDTISIGDTPTYYSNSGSNSSQSDTQNLSNGAVYSVPQQVKPFSRAVTPVRPPPSYEFDPRLQGVLNQLSPAQLQHLLASLSSQSLNDATPSVPSTINPTATTTNGLLTPYQQPASFDFSINPAQTAVYNSSGIPVVAPEGLIPFDAYDPESPIDERHGNLGLVNSPSLEQQQHEARMERSWQAAEDIDKDVSALNTSIHSLIQTLGLDPSLLDDHTTAPASSTAESTPDHNMQSNTVPETNVNPSDFDFFDSFFNNISTSSGNSVSLPGGDGDNAGGGSSNADMDYNDLASTAFLDEVPTPVSDITGSPARPLRQVSPGLLDLGTANDHVVNSPSSGMHLTSPGGGAKGPITGSDAGARLKRKSDVIMDLDGVSAARTNEPNSSTKAQGNMTGTLKTKKRKEK